MKVGVNIENDIERASTIRDVIGWENDLVSSASLYTFSQAIVHILASHSTWVRSSPACLYSIYVTTRHPSKCDVFFLFLFY
jgi:hypothetical protein